MKIKDKEYMLVNERLRIFRKEYPEHSLRIDWIVCNAEIAIGKAVIRDENDRQIAEGTAMEIFGSSFINKTSHIENCETSAWGRALANLGIGIGTSVASAEEVQNAQLNQEKTPKINDEKYISDKKVDILLALAKDKKYNDSDLISFLTEVFGLRNGKVLSQIEEIVKSKIKLEEYFAKANISSSSKYFELMLEWGKEL